MSQRYKPSARLNDLTEEQRGAIQEAIALASDCVDLSHRLWGEQLELLARYAQARAHLPETSVDVREELDTSVEGLALLRQASERLSAVGEDLLQALIGEEWVS